MHYKCIRSRTLIVDPDNPALIRQRRQDNDLWEPSDPERDTIWLSELVQEIRNRLLLRINFGITSQIDDASVTAGLLLLDAWARIDPKVKSVFPVAI